jgi:hypothetical protein
MRKTSLHDVSWLARDLGAAANDFDTAPSATLFIVKIEYLQSSLLGTSFELVVHIG